MSKVFQFLKDESGATAIEYGLIAAGISVVIIATVNAIGSSLNSKVPIYLRHAEIKSLGSTTKHTPCTVLEETAAWSRRFLFFAMSASDAVDANSEASKCHSAVALSQPTLSGAIRCAHHLPNARSGDKAGMPIAPKCSLNGSRQIV